MIHFAQSQFCRPIPALHVIAVLPIGAQADAAEAWQQAIEVAFSHRYEALGRAFPGRAP